MKTTAFSSLNITPTINTFTGDKIKVSRVLNNEIIIHDYKIEPSKFKDNRLVLSIEFKGTRHVIFTGSKTLQEMIQQVDRKHLPLSTTIIDENERLLFT